MATFQGDLSAKGMKFAIVAARFNWTVTEKLVEGAKDALVRHGSTADSIDTILVPGCFEIPMAAKKAAGKGGYDAIIAVGAVIRGETPHFDYVAAETARGVARAADETGVPVAFGVLTTDTMDQAVDRAGGQSGNKGFDAAVTAIETAALMKALA
jgi:6,7-dimethyl-8-ribityllumazine synthase